MDSSVLTVLVGAPLSSCRTLVRVRGDDQQ